MRGVFLLLILFEFLSSNFIFATEYTCNSTFTCGCAASSTVITARIVGGEPAANYAWGWIVSLRQFGSHICGASLISSQYAITAAHCVKAVLDYPSALSIIAGTNYLNDGSSSTVQQRTVTKIISHPNYDSETVTYDIAILQFSPLTISSESKLAFICLPSPNQDPFEVNSNVVAIGWGTTYVGNATVSNSLQQVTLQVYSSTSADCISSRISDSNLQFCAGTAAGDKDTCQGDSGGPLLAFNNDRWVLAGITSFGVGKCARAGYAGVYTRVSALTSFITSNTDSFVSTDVLNDNSVQSKNTGNTAERFILTLIFPLLFLLILSCSY